jgi:hypothetical protein
MALTFVRDDLFPTTTPTPIPRRRIPTTTNRENIIYFTKFSSIFFTNYNDYNLLA